VCTCVHIDESYIRICKCLCLYDQHTRTATITDEEKRRPKRSNLKTYECRRKKTMSKGIRRRPCCRPSSESISDLEAKVEEGPDRVLCFGSRSTM
jgi:hypothetical protein